ncbi:Queuine tRNA-ribosyltransferase subunit qtrtd1 [Massospora cicadina]|nr:Queuine tRNA-ribosyltransferase subunit qtrtd1 [Massospora cicadina]
MVSKEGVELETKKFKKEPSEIETCPGIHHTSIDQSINLPGYKDLPYSFSEFTGTESQLTLMDVHDPASRYYYKPEAIKPWKTGWAFATLATAQGLLKVTAGAYAEKVASFKMDIAVCLYDCMPNVATKVSKTGALSPPESKLELPSRPRVVKSLEKTYNWTEVCTLAPSVSGTSLISAVVGGPYADLRVQSAKLALGLGDKISGYLVANLHGEEEEKLDQLRQSIDVLQPELLASPKPVFSWEFITPREVLLAVENGVDVFDSTNEFSRAYVVHLLNTHEMLAKTLLMCHNLQVYLNFFDSIRATIDNGTFENQKRLFLERHVDVDWFEFLNAELTIPSSQKDAASGLD